MILHKLYYSQPMTRKKAFFFHSFFMNQYLLSSSGVQPSLYYHLFESRAKRYVNDDAPLFIDAADTKSYLSFNQLRSHVREFAAHLIDKGMKQGDIVAICAPGAVSVAMDEQYGLVANANDNNNQIEYPIVMHGVIASGKKYSSDRASLMNMSDNIRWRGNACPRRFNWPRDCSIVQDGKANHGGDTCQDPACCT